MPPSDDDAKRLIEAADTLAEIIREAQRVKAEVETRLRQIRLAGKPATPRIERRKPAPKRR